MDRREAITVLGVAFASAAAPVSPRAAIAASLSRVRPGDPGWPSAASWERLNRDTSGNLLHVRDMFEACRPNPAGAACTDLATQVRNPFFLGDQPAGTQVSGWLGAWIPAPSVYAVRARSARDVAAAVNFARDNRLRLVVKGTGHSYQGTSNAADSLLIWTRAMNDIALHDAFVPNGCAAPPIPAVTVGAGAVWIDVYDAVTRGAGRYAQGGGCTDVGVAGLVQSGGFGGFSKGFGTAAAGLLEAEIVTADGEIRTANACQHPDLFWAIKGGGGGSWGVVTKLTLRTHDLPNVFGGAVGKIAARSETAYRTLIARLVEFTADALLTPNWGEQVHLGPDNTLEISMSCHSLDAKQIAATWQPFFDWVTARPNDFEIATRLRTYATNPRSFWEVDGNPAMVPDARPGAPKHHGWWRGDSDQVWAFIHGYDSLWMPRGLLDGGRRATLVDALFAGSRHKVIQLHFNKGLAGASPDVLAAAKNTATNPAVLEAFALAIIADAEAGPVGGARAPIDATRARADADAISRAAAALRGVAPDGGSYVSESDYFNADWQRAFWGPNYPRLLAIKATYDPDGLFFVHHGVGTETWSADGFQRRR